MSTYHPSHRRVRSGRTASGIRVGASGVFAAATAIGLLTVPVPAQAAPACTNYQFNGRFDLNQSNGAHVYFDSNGPVASGAAFAGGSSLMNGDVSGTIQGRHLDFTIVWDQGPAGHYKGDVDDAGFAHGFTVDTTNASSTATWDSTIPLGCVTPPAAPAPIPGEARIPKQDSPFPKKPTDPVPQKSVAVISDTDVFDKPSDQGGRVVLVNGQKLFLDAGVDQVKLVGGCTKQTWCTVTNPKIPLPNNTGAVWGGHLDVPAG